MRNRYYNPEIKRFMNRDVIVGNIEDSQTLNRYAYVNGNPITYNDPFGLARESIVGSSWLSNIQTTLDIAGMVPGLGVLPDVINAGIYLSTGNYEEALWSGIGAVPIVGDATSGVRNVGKISKAVNSKIKNKVENPIKEYEVETYRDFNRRSVVGDNLEGHEVWQHANLKAKGLATTRNSTEVSKNNPVIALYREEHKKVNKAQRSLEAKKQSPYDNIMSNSKILEEIGVPKNRVEDVTNKALEHMRETMKGRS